MKKIGIIGSGISGLSAGKMLRERFDVTILEASSSIGGLIKCSRVNGNLFHRVGGHVFNSKNKKVLDWFWSNFDRNLEFIKAKRNAKILLKKRYIGYPIENYLYQLPELDVQNILSDLLEISVIGREQKPANFREFLLMNFGRTLFELYFEPYNSKIWNIDLSKVPLHWLEGKLPMPKTIDILLSNIVQREETDMVHASFYYPKVNGSQFLVDRLAEGQKVILNEKVEKIEKLHHGIILNKDENKIYDKIIYTGDIRKLHYMVKNIPQATQEALNSVKDLSSNGTSNVLCETDDMDISWLYIPEKEFKAHRIIYTGNFSYTNNGSNTNRKTCVVEFSGMQERSCINVELKKLPGNLVPIDYNYEPNSYIIHDDCTNEKVDLVKKELEKENIYILGRFAEWQYYNMDMCIEKAMEIRDKLLATSL